MRRNTLRRTLSTAAMAAGILGLGATVAAADTYEVRSGDTLASIARAHDQVSSWQDLHAANESKLADPNLIVPGQQLRLSGTGEGTSGGAEGTYTVQAGDTLASIARSIDGVASWQQLADANALADPHLIMPGQVLELSGQASSSATSASSGGDTGSSGDGSSSSSSDAATQTSGSVSTSTWDALAECESNGDWSINTGNGYYGGLQFALSSWQWVGGSGYPHEASKEEQIHRAEILLERQGWGAWPACSSMLGLR